MPYFIKSIISENKIQLSYTDQSVFDLTFSRNLTLANAVNLAFLANLAYLDMKNHRIADAILEKGFFESKRGPFGYENALNFASPFLK